MTDSMSVLLGEWKDCKRQPRLLNFDSNVGAWASPMESRRSKECSRGTARSHESTVMIDSMSCIVLLNKWLYCCERRPRLLSFESSGGRLAAVLFGWTTPTAIIASFIEARRLQRCLLGSGVNSKEPPVITDWRSSGTVRCVCLRRPRLLSFMTQVGLSGTTDAADVSFLKLRLGFTAANTPRLSTASLMETRRSKWCFRGTGVSSKESPVLIESRSSGVLRVDLVIRPRLLSFGIPDVGALFATGLGFMKRRTLGSLNQTTLIASFNEARWERGHCEQTSKGL